MKSLLWRLYNPHRFTRRYLTKGVRKYGWEVGDFSYGRPQVRFARKGRMLRIGRFCSFSDTCTLHLGGNHHAEWVSTYPFLSFPSLWGEGTEGDNQEGSKGAVIIGHVVWICDGAVVLSGVSIGHGAVIAAGAVVSRDVRPYAVMAGNPAREVKRRFDDDMVDALLALEWWHWPVERIRKAVALLQSGQIKDFIENA